jgi:cell division septal protein FtsQ
MDRYIKSYGSLNLNKPAKNNRKFFLFKIFGKKARTNTIVRREISNNKDSISQRYLAPNRPQQKTKSRNWRKIFITFFLFTLMITWGLLMLYLPYFKVSAVEFSGLNIIEKDEIGQYVNERYLKGKILPKNNYFLIRTKKIEKNLLNKYSANAVKLTKIFPDKILIEINEKISTIIYYNGEDYYLLDRNGEIIKKIFLLDKDQLLTASENKKIIDDENEQISTSTINAIVATSSTDVLYSTTGTPTEILGQTSSLTTNNSNIPEWRKLIKDYEGIPIFFDKSDATTIGEREYILPNGIIEFVIEWNRIMKDEGIGEARYYETDNLSAGITAVVDKAWKIYIQPKNSLITQVNNLKIILDNREANPREYIDLRYDERVFWK